MKVVDPGRSYQLAAGNGLVFLQKDESRVIRDGTTNEEVLEVLIDRVTEAYQELPCQESIRALYLLREALVAFRTRSARRANAKVEGTRRPHPSFIESGDVRFGRTAARQLETLDFAPN